MHLSGGEFEEMKEKGSEALTITALGSLLSGFRIRIA